MVQRGEGNGDDVMHKKNLHADEVDSAALLDTMEASHCLLVVLIHHHHLVTQHAFRNWVDGQFGERASRLHFAELVRINNNHIIDGLEKPKQGTLIYELENPPKQLICRDMEMGHRMHTLAKCFSLLGRMRTSGHTLRSKRSNWFESTPLSGSDARPG